MRVEGFGGREIFLREAFELVSLKFSNNKTCIMPILLCSLLKTLSLRYP